MTITSNDMEHKRDALTVSPAESADSVPQWVIKHTVPDTGEALPPGFPYIVDGVSGDICQVALLYLADEYLTSRRSFNANTVAAYSSDLLDWMRYGARFGLPWDKATYGDLGRYVDSLDLVSPHLGQAARPSTVDRRLTSIRGMYEWASKNLPEFCVDAPEGTLLKARNVADFIDDRRKELRNRPDSSWDPTEEASLPNVMQPVEVAAALKAIGPAPAESKTEDQLAQASETSIGHLGMDIGCQAGLRVGEVVNLRIKFFMKFIGTEVVPNRTYDIGPFRRKGGKRKTVKFHGLPLRKVMNYIEGERKCAMQGRKADHGFLLVHQKDRFRGQRITESTLQRRFAKACMSAGLVKSVSKVRAAEGDRKQTTTINEERPAFTFHDLRHTFAVWMYYARKQDGDAEPWKYIQEQLGHEDVLTTIKTYLRVTQDFEAQVTDKYISTLNLAAGVVDVNDMEDELGALEQEAEVQ